MQHSNKIMFSLLQQEATNKQIHFSVWVIHHEDIHVCHIDRRLQRSSQQGWDISNSTEQMNIATWCQINIFGKETTLLHIAFDCFSVSAFYLCLQQNRFIYHKFKSHQLHSSHNALLESLFFLVGLLNSVVNKALQKSIAATVYAPPLP